MRVCVYVGVGVVIVVKRMANQEDQLCVYMCALYYMWQAQGKREHFVHRNLLKSCTLKIKSTNSTFLLEKQNLCSFLDVLVFNQLFVH